jgi:hypothetical protein
MDEKHHYLQKHCVLVDKNEFKNESKLNKCYDFIKNEDLENFSKLISDCSDCSDCSDDLEMFKNVINTGGINDEESYINDIQNKPFDFINESVHESINNYINNINSDSENSYNDSDSDTERYKDPLYLKKICNEANENILNNEDTMNMDLYINRYSSFDNEDIDYITSNSKKITSLPWDTKHMYNNKN